MGNSEGNHTTATERTDAQSADVSDSLEKTPSSAEVVEELLDRTEALEARVSELEAQLRESRGQNSDVVEGVDTSDHRDRAVVQKLESGDVVTVRTLQQLYTKHTDITSSETLRDRVKNLVSHSAFTDVGSGWRFDPDGGGSR